MVDTSNTIQLEFDTKGNEKQKLCAKYWADDETTDIIYGGSKGSAKSFTGCNLIFSDALTYPNTHYFIARKVLADIVKFTIPSIHEVFEVWGLTSDYYKYNGKDNVYHLYNGSKVFLLAAKYLPSDPQYQRFGSMQMTRGWIEEAGEFEESCKNNLKISIGRWNNDKYNLKGKLLQTCNPSKNYLYKSYYRKFKDGTLSKFIKFIQALPTDNKMLDSGYLDNLFNTLKGSERERLLEGNWEYDDSPDALMEYDAIVDLFTNTQVLRTKKKFLVCDIALRGSDKFVLSVWDGLVLIDSKEIPKNNGKDIVDEMGIFKEKYSIRNSHIVFDADGVGGGVTGWYKGAIEFHNGASPIEEKEDKKKDKKGKVNYEHLKAQCAYKLADYVNEGKIYIKGVDENKQNYIIEELEQLKSRDKDKEGKLKIVRKQDIIKKLGRSPDYLDVMIMRMYFELKPPKKKSKTRGSAW